MKMTLNISVKGRVKILIKLRFWTVLILSMLRTQERDGSVHDKKCRCRV